MTTLVFFSHYEENQSPRMEGRNVGGVDFFAAAALIDSIAKALRSVGIDATPESTHEIEHNGQRGRLFYGGGPMVSRTKRLAITTVGAAILLKAITASEPIIKDYLEKEKAASITYESGNTKITIRGRNDFEKLVEALKER